MNVKVVIEFEGPLELAQRFLKEAGALSSRLLGEPKRTEKVGRVGPQRSTPGSRTDGSRTDVGGHHSGQSKVAGGQEVAPSSDVGSSTLKNRRILVSAPESARLMKEVVLL